MFKYHPLQHLKITSPFGKRVHPITGEFGYHNGIDASCAIGTPLYAVLDGKVVASKTNNGGDKVGLGHYIVVEHSNCCTVCAHMREVGLPVGTVVKAGDIIGYTGNSGRSTGPHLHFEVRAGKYTGSFWTKDKEDKYLTAVDPMLYMVTQKQEESIESIVARMQKRNLVSDATYWIEVIKGQRELDPKHLKCVFENVLKEA